MIESLHVGLPHCCLLPSSRTNFKVAAGSHHSRAEQLTMRCHPLLLPLHRTHNVRLSRQRQHLTDIHIWQSIVRTICGLISNEIPENTQHFLHPRLTSSSNEEDHYSCPARLDSIDGTPIHGVQIRPPTWKQSFIHRKTMEGVTTKEKRAE